MNQLLIGVMFIIYVLFIAAVLYRIMRALEKIVDFVRSKPEEKKPWGS
jgi:hypothetical protein